MGIYTQKEKELLAVNLGGTKEMIAFAQKAGARLHHISTEVRKRLLSFASMSGKKFFREVQSRLSPEELEEYLEENPEERIYLMTPPHK